MKNTGSIKTKLILIITFSLLVPMLIVITISSSKLRNDSIIMAKADALKKADNYSRGIEQDLGQVIKALSIYADVFSENINENEVSNFSLEQIHNMEYRFLLENKQVLTVFINFLPGSFSINDTLKFNENLTSFKYSNHKGKYFYEDNYDYDFKSDVINYLQKNNGQIFTEPYYDIVDGDSILMISYGEAIYNDDEIIGVLGIDISINWMQNRISDSKIFNGKLQTYIVSDGGIINADSKNKSNAGKNINNVYAADSSFIQSKLSEINDNGYFKFHTPINFKQANKVWHIIIKVPENVILKGINFELFKRVVFIIILLIIAIFIAYFYTKKIISRILKIAKVAEQIAKGNLDVSFEVIGNDELEKLSESLQIMVNKFYDIIKSIKKASEDLYKSGSSLSQTAIKLSEGASEQASSTEEVSASMEQLNANIEQNAENSKEASKMAQKSASEIEISSKTVINTANAMNDIASKVSIIGDIAFQTNILALNAAVEAARAGKFGKGFGVVAKEVGKLADNSKIAANEINNLTQKSTKSASSSGELLKTIVPNIQKTATLVQEITNASIEQRSGTDQINNAIQQLNNITQQNASMSEQLAINVEQLNSYADKLSDLIGFFNLDKTNNNNTDNINSEVIDEEEILNEFSDTDFNNTEENIDINEEKTNIVESENKSETKEINNNVEKNIGEGYNFDLEKNADDDEFENF